MSDAFIGFYWTLPVFWAGFRSLPTDADAAAAKSQTIRYQRDRVKRHVQENAGRLVDELVFIDVRTDRGTELVTETLAKAYTLCLKSNATLLYIDFAQVLHWRRHPALQAFLDEHAFADGLSPDSIGIDGRLFDPVQHFRRWRQSSETEASKRRQSADAELTALAHQTPVTRGRYGVIADTLNARQVLTPSGRVWTAENVRIALRRRGLIQSNDSTVEP